MKLQTFIKLYRRSRLVKRMTRLAISVHHLMRPAVRTPCTLADCSGTGLAEAETVGWKALPGILARMNACGGWMFCPEPPLAGMTMGRYGRGKCISMQWGDDICPMSVAGRDECQKWRA